MFWIQPLDVWNKQTRTLNMDESANIYINKNIVIKSFERWLYARISKTYDAVHLEVYYYSVWTIPMVFQKTTIISRVALARAQAQWLPLPRNESLQK